MKDRESDYSYKIQQVDNQLIDLESKFQFHFQSITMQLENLRMRSRDKGIEVESNDYIIQLNMILDKIEDYYYQEYSRLQYEREQYIYEATEKGSNLNGKS